MNHLRCTVRLLALVAPAILSLRAGAATVTWSASNAWYDQDANWDTASVPGIGDTARFTNAYATSTPHYVYFSNDYRDVGSLEVYAATGFNHAILRGNPDFAGALRVSNRVDIYTDGTTTNDSAWMVPQFMYQFDVTNDTGTAVLEVGNRGKFLVFMDYGASLLGTVRVDRIVSTNVESQVHIQGGVLETRHGVEIVHRVNTGLQVGQYYPSVWRMLGGTNRIAIASNQVLFVGLSGSASNSLVEIAGAGTVYTNLDGNTMVGSSANDCRFIVRDGAYAYLAGTNGYGYFFVGYNGHRGGLLITGSNTLAQSHNGFVIGAGGYLYSTGAYCEISGGAAYNAVGVSDIVIGGGGSFSTALVTGAGTWITISNSNFQVGQNATAKGNQFIVSSGAVAVANQLLINLSAGASDNLAMVRDGGVFRINHYTTQIAAPGYGTISNIGGVYQFRTAAPTMNTNGGPISIESGTISFLNVNNAPLLPGAGLTNLTWMGDNTFELVNSTNAAVGAYTFDAVANTGNPTNYQTLALDGGGARVTNLTIGADGRLRGSGTVNSETVEMNGLMTPGSSAGALSFSGDLEIGSSADVEMEIGGLAGAAYDRVIVLGDVTLDGTLDAFLINGYEPGHGDDFTLIDNQGANPVTGTFTGMTNGHVFAAGGGFFRIRYDGGDGNDVTLEYEAAGGGDTDGDGIPDWWESLHYGGPTNANPGASASNGVNTVLEAWIADLNPTNAGSVLPPIALSNAPYGQLWLVLDPTSTARLYEVSATTNLDETPASWSVYGGAQTGSGAGVLFAVTNDAPRRNYRAGVRLP